MKERVDGRMATTNDGQVAIMDRSAHEASGRSRFARQAAAQVFFCLPFKAVELFLITSSSSSGIFLRASLLGTNTVIGPSARILSQRPQKFYGCERTIGSQETEEGIWLALASLCESDTSDSSMSSSSCKVGSQ